MIHARRWSAGLLGLGILIGTAADRLPVRTVPRSGEFWILQGDFHVHAAPGDGTLLPWDLRREAARAGLDVIAITNHNTTIAGWFGRWWASRAGRPHPLVLAGEEVTSPDYHMAAVGIATTVSRRQTAASAIAAIHAQGGVAIAAHPSRRYWPGYDVEALALLDGAEASNNTDPIAIAEYAAFRRRALERNPGVAAIGSSDFHGWPALGRSRTYLLVRDRTEAGVLEAIRSGRTVAADDRGSLYGDPDLVRIVEAHRPAGRSNHFAAWRRLSVALAWTGVLGLILFGRVTR